VRLFNRRRYLSAQQVWEASWQKAPSEERPFLEALVQLAAALHMRTRRGATRGAEHLLARALATMEDQRPGRHGVDVDALLTEFGAWHDWLHQTRRPHRLLDALRIPKLR
jgi:predicted metal-dependent hydrolase